MGEVVDHGTGTAARQPFPVYGKTGTTDDFTQRVVHRLLPTLCISVWMGYDKEYLHHGTVPHSMKNVEGKGEVFGGKLPAEIFAKTFSNYRALQARRASPSASPTPDVIVDRRKSRPQQPQPTHARPAPSRSPSQQPSPSSQPSESPSPTPSRSLLPTRRRRPATSAQAPAVVRSVTVRQVVERRGDRVGRRGAGCRRCASRRASPAAWPAARRRRRVRPCDVRLAAAAAVFGAARMGDGDRLRRARVVCRRCWLVPRPMRRRR